MGAADLCSFSLRCSTTWGRCLADQGHSCQRQEDCFGHGDSKITCKQGSCSHEQKLFGEKYVYHAIGSDCNTDKWLTCDKIKGICLMNSDGSCGSDYDCAKGRKFTNHGQLSGVTTHFRCGSG
jgi:hypothetical protein